MKEDVLSEFRCNCGKLLFKGADLFGKIEIKCKRCGRIKTFCKALVPCLAEDDNEQYDAAAAQAVLDK